MRPGGFGMLIVRQIVDELVYNERGNEVLLIKHLNSFGSARHPASTAVSRAAEELPLARSEPQSARSVATDEAVEAIATARMGLLVSWKSRSVASDARRIALLEAQPQERAASSRAATNRFPANAGSERRRDRTRCRRRQSRRQRASAGAVGRRPSRLAGRSAAPRGRGARASAIQSAPRRGMPVQPARRDDSRSRTPGCAPAGPPASCRRCCIRRTLPLYDATAGARPVRTAASNAAYSLPSGPNAERAAAGLAAAGMSVEEHDALAEPALDFAEATQAEAPACPRRPATV